MRPRSTDRPFILYPKEVHPTSEASLMKCVSAARRSMVRQSFENLLKFISGACIRFGDMKSVLFYVD